jgi:hypothetical protein
MGLPGVDCGRTGAAKDVRLHVDRLKVIRVDAESVLAKVINREVSKVLTCQHLVRHSMREHRRLAIGVLHLTVAVAFGGCSPDPAGRRSVHFLPEPRLEGLCVCGHGASVPHSMGTGLTTCATSQHEPKAQPVNLRSLERSGGGSDGQAKTHPSGATTPKEESRQPAFPPAFSLRRCQSAALASF